MKKQLYTTTTKTELPIMKQPLQRLLESNPVKQNRQYKDRWLMLYSYHLYARRMQKITLWDMMCTKNMAWGSIVKREK